ncbi:MAG: hypothetical protein JNN15_05905 [Blastocatellia bacterium]|nr:hypothetical protein [Blastocatellia bacterium]
MLKYLLIVPIILISFTYSLANSSEEEKAKELIINAIKALGDKAYVSVKSEKSRGIIVPYKNSNPSALEVQSFSNYILLPEKERVDFKGRGRRYIQSNSGSRGWVYDSDSQILRDQTEEQCQMFLKSLRYQIDHILRGGWMAEGVTLSYLPKQEIWTRQFGDGVQITFSDGEQIKLFFDLQTRLPLSVRFPKRSSNTATPTLAENRFYKFVEINGIKSPQVVDLFEDGQQVLRINYEEREFNVEIAEKLFIKPESAKSLK